MIPFQNFWGKNRKIGKGTKIGAFVDIGDEVIIGRNCKIQCFVNIPQGVMIGDNVFIGPHVAFTNDKYPEANDNWELVFTEIEDNVSIGANATLLPGIHVGEGAKIGAGAVVTKNVPAGETWVGNPAHQI